ncbi:glycosyltransferase family 4 protein [Candidatus Margulisiibacteriota bacterium]
MNKKTRIAVIGVRGLPATSGGAEGVVENISVNLVKSGADVTVFCRPHYCEQKESSYKGVKLRYVPCLNTKHFEAISHTFICSLIAAFGPYDVVHYHSIGPSLMSWIPRLLGKRVVATCHGLDWKRDKWGKLAKMFLKLGEKASALFPHVTTAVSPTLVKYYKDKHNKEVVYIPNGISEINYAHSPEILTKFDLERDGYILYLSRIVPEKRLDLLVDAFDKVDTKKKLVIAGDASHTDDYLRKIKEKVKENTNIVFTGPVYGMDKYILFNNAAVFVLPSELEGMPIVLMEALAVGCPCLASDIEENKAVLEPAPYLKYGELFKQGKEEDLIEKLNLLLADQELRGRYQSLGPEYVFTQFNWEKIVKKYSEIIS